MKWFLAIVMFAFLALPSQGFEFKRLRVLEGRFFKAERQRIFKFQRKCQKPPENKPAPAPKQPGK